jgi:putative transposase
VLKLGLPPALRRFFARTSCIENLIGTLRHVTRNIKRWRDGDMRRRWIGLGLWRAPCASGASRSMTNWAPS